MLTHRSPIESIAFLDIDRTSILYSHNNSEHKHELNPLLMSELAKLKQYDVVFFSNMSTRDIQYLSDDKYVRCITREKLIQLFEENGFRVHGVITPADPAYYLGPGAAYRDLYKVAYDKAQRKENNKNECDEFHDYFSDIQISNWIKHHYSRKAAQKYTMFEYFLNNIPANLKDLKRINYYDDDHKCLEAVYLANYHASSSIEVVLFHVKGKKSIERLMKVTPKISKLAMTMSDRAKPYSDMIKPYSNGLLVGGATLLIYGLFALKYMS